MYSRTYAFYFVFRSRSFLGLECGSLWATIKRWKLYSCLHLDMVMWRNWPVTIGIVNMWPRVILSWRSRPNPLCCASGIKSGIDPPFICIPHYTWSHAEHSSRPAVYLKAVLNLLSLEVNIGFDSSLCKIVKKLKNGIYLQTLLMILKSQVQWKQEDCQKFVSLI